MNCPWRTRAPQACATTIPSTAAQTGQAGQTGQASQERGGQQGGGGSGNDLARLRDEYNQKMREARDLLAAGGDDAAPATYQPQVDAYFRELAKRRR